MDGQYYLESVRLIALAREGYAASLRGLKDPRSVAEAIAILGAVRDEAQGIAVRAANLVDLLCLTLQEGGRYASNNNTPKEP